MGREDAHSPTAAIYLGRGGHLFIEDLEVVPVLGQVMRILLDLLVGSNDSGGY